MSPSPKDGRSLWASNANGGGEFGAELKRAQDHQSSKMAAATAAGSRAAESEAATGSDAGTNSPTPLPVSDSPGNDALPLYSTQDNKDTDVMGPSNHDDEDAKTGAGPSGSPIPGESESTPLENARAVRSEDVLNDDLPHSADVADSGQQNGEPEATSVHDENPDTDSKDHAQEAAGVSTGADDRLGVADAEEIVELPPGKIRVRALYDYEATQDGDLSFVAGDIIVTDGSTFSGDGWVSGTCHGETGIFPANYTEPC